VATHVTIEDALDYCLLNPDGLSDEELLARFPQYTEQLEPLLACALSLREFAPPPVPLERRAAMKERLVTAAAGLQAAATVPLPLATVSPNGVAKTNKPASRKGGAFVWPKLMWPRMALVGAAMAASVVLFVWWSAANSMPDSPFYDVKLTSERLMVDINPSPAERVRAHAAIADARLAEVQTLASQGELDMAGKALDNYREHINGCTAALSETQGNEQAELAKMLYTSTDAGTRVFQTLEKDPALPVALKDNVQDTLDTVVVAKTQVTQVLVAVQIDPASIPTRPVALPEVAGSPEPGGGVAAALATATRTQLRGDATPQTSPQDPAGTAVAVGPTSTGQGQFAQATNTRVRPRPVAQATNTRTTPGRVVSASTRQPTTPPSVTRTVTGTLTLTLTPQRTSTRTAVPSRTRTAVPTNTAIVGGATNTPESRQTSTSTITPEPPGPTGVPPTDTSTPAPPTETFTPEPEPPTNTPVPPTDTREPTNTRTPTNTPAPPTPVPTADVCSLEVSNVDAKCVSPTCLNWSASVANSGNQSVSADWLAELQISRAGGGFQTVATLSGNTNFTPGTTVVGDSFCYDFPPDTNRYKVRFTVSGSGSSCHPQGTTGAQRPCSDAPTPTRVPTNTRTPRP
jgi:hypothetical protein